MSNSNDWKLFTNDGEIHADRTIPAAPPWRTFAQQKGEERKRPRFIFEDHEIDLINAALLLRRPLLITGKPGVGKSSLIYAVARELGLGPVLVWPINTRSTLEHGLYRYDAIGRLQELEAARARRERTPVGAASDEELDSPESLGRYITLGPLGTAFLPHDRPRALLLDEIDKSDIDLPNDLLNLFEEGWYEIPVLARVTDKWDKVPVRPYGGDIRDTVLIEGGKVRVREFPFVVMTSNGERDFPQPFLRRCIRMHIEQPDAKKLGRIISDYFDDKARAESVQLIEDFFMRAHKGDVATDQLLNAVFLSTQYSVDLGHGKKSLYDLLLRDLKS